jgi:hypothetical protein
MAKNIINIFFIFIVLATSLPVKHAARIFFKKAVQEEMCDDCCDDAPIKKADDSIGFKDFPYCHYYGVDALHPTSQILPQQVYCADWRLPLWPAVDIHTPPPNRA